MGQTFCLKKLDRGYQRTQSCMPSSVPLKKLNKRLPEKDINKKEKTKLSFSTFIIDHRNLLYIYLCMPFFFLELFQRILF
jgi:hypothetical protein